MNIKNEIRKIIQMQGRSVLASQRYVDGAFVKAVEAIYRCKGKLVITGVGKSGLIAEKFASTLSSTGTPAIFLHPVEGMHGNLGVLQKNDIVFAIGKSGESEELLSILPAVRKIGV